ncbi:hypothetical protein ACTWJ8_17410 [Streptomyces sp. SDT5-1]|uniref:hypothetical protein n=1 Tax=Streptomyces sp. SDT5-1 TaxID=3406418 RepID=UPI003FD0002A
MRVMKKRASIRYGVVGAVACAVIGLAGCAGGGGGPEAPTGGEVGDTGGVATGASVSGAVPSDEVAGPGDDGAGGGDPGVPSVQAPPKDTGPHGGPGNGVTPSDGATVAPTPCSDTPDSYSDGPYCVPSGGPDPEPDPPGPTTTPPEPSPETSDN